MNEKALSEICARLISNDSTSPTNLRMCVCSDEEMEELAAALKQNKTLLSLYLYVEGTTEKGLETLIQILKENKISFSLDLSFSANINATNTARLLTAALQLHL